MPRFDPSELTKNNSFSGKSYQDVIDTMLYAGFVPIRQGKHMMMRYYDPDAPLLTNISFMLSHDHGPVNKVYVKEACAKCLEVEQRNEERRTREKLEPLPDWVKDSLPHEFVKTQDGNELIVARHKKNDPNNLRLQTYRVQRRKVDGADVIRISCPANPEHADVIYRYENTSNYKNGLRNFFEDYDREEVALVEHQYAKFQDKLRYLVKDAGYKAAEIDTDPRQIQLTHPLYHLDFVFVMPDDAQPVTREAHDVLADAENEMMEKLLGQEAFIDQLKTVGWICKRTEHPATIHFSRKEHEVRVPLVGSLEMFDIDEVRQQTARLDKPKNTVDTRVIESTTPHENIKTMLKNNMICQKTQLRRALTALNVEFATHSDSSLDIITGDLAVSLPNPCHISFDDRDVVKPEHQQRLKILLWAVLRREELGAERPTTMVGRTAKSDTETGAAAGM